MSDTRGGGRPPIPGPTKVECPCREPKCTAYGVLSKRTGHVQRACKCRGCLGGRNRVRGLRKQRVARKKLGVPAGRYHGEAGNEENWRWYFRAEVKSGKQVGQFAWYFKQEFHAESSRAHGDSRPFAFVAMPEGMGDDGLVTTRMSALAGLVTELEALREQIAELMREKGG